MNLKSFKYVLALANEGSFSKAAEQLNIKQPSLSQYIKKVEQEVGMELFVRAGGTVHLTDAGRVYIEVGRKMLDLEHQLEERFCDIASYKTGTITIGISAHRSVALMPEIVKAFHQRYPGIILKLEELQRSDILVAAEHGYVDLCLTTLPIDNSIFIYETVMTEENVIAVPSGMGLNGKVVEGRKFPAVSASVLNGMRFVMLNEEHPMQSELHKLCVENNLQLSKTIECTSLETLLEMVKAGLGSAFIPSCLAKPDLNLECYSIIEETNKREIVLVYRKEQYISQAMKDLMTIIKDVLKD